MSDFQNILQPEVQKWIFEHWKEDAYQLAFKKSPFPNVAMQELVQQVHGQQIAQKKIPEFFLKEGIIFPPKINLEQTSSAVTARFKSKIISGDNLVDITGGLGIDCIEFSKKLNNVVHIEQNEILQNIASNNFNVLKIKNIKSIQSDGISYLNAHPELNDILYVDPSRRSITKQKVFLLEDLTPNILAFLPQWKNQFNQIWIKLSPMIDVTYLIKEITDLSQIFLISIKNELKEILIQIQSHPLKKITCVNLETHQNDFIIDWNQELPLLSYSSVKKYLYEPNAAIQKSGMIDFITQKLNIKKIHPNSQIFTSDEIISDFPGRIFEITAAVKNPKKELKGKSIQAIHRNFPESIHRLQKKFKFKTDGTSPVIFTQTEHDILILKAENVKV